MEMAKKSTAPTSLVPLIILVTFVSVGALPNINGKSAPIVSPNRKDYHEGSSLATQAEAIAHTCPTEFRGQIVTPLLPDEVDRLRDYLLLHGLQGEMILTAGAKFQNRPWEWLYTLNPISNLINWHPACGPTSLPSAALCFQADSLTEYGFCECQFTDRYKPICEVESVQECGLISDVSVEFPIYDNDTIGVPVIELLTTPEVTFISLPSEPKYFDITFDRPSHTIGITPKDTLATFFDNSEDPHLSIVNLQLSCPAGVVKPVPEIKILILDGNSSPPNFEPSNASYEIKLPFGGAPINWKNFVKVTDKDVLELNTALTFQTIQSDMIDLTGFPVERVPENVDSRLEYYELYFGLNPNWNQAGSFPFEIMAMDHFGKSAVFQGQLNILES